MALFLFFIGAFFAAIIGNAIKHRLDAIKKGEPTGSLWWHAKRFLKESEEAQRQRRRKREDERINRANSVLSRATASPSVGNAKEEHHNNTTSSSRRKRHQKNYVSMPQTSNRGLDRIRFSYFNDGIQTSRTVTVYGVNHYYFEGYCHLRQAIRTFSLKKVCGDITSLTTGEVQRPFSWAKQTRRQTGNKPISISSDNSSLATTKKNSPRHWETAVLFAGFHETRRERLKVLAELSGWQVRTNFGDSLDVMVLGPSSGDVQRRQANEMGVEIISEADFMGRVQRS